MNFFRQAVLFEGGLGIVAILIGVCCRFPFWQDCVFNVAALWQTLLALIPLMIGYYILQTLPLKSLREIDRIVKELVTQKMPDFALWHFAIISLLAGFGEEFLFRGLLQNGFDAWFNYSQTLPVLIVVSILFGLAHNITKIYFLLAFLIAIYLGALLLLTQNLFVPVAVHALYDFCVFIAVKRELKINGK